MFDYLNFNTQILLFVNLNQWSQTWICKSEFCNLRFYIRFIHKYYRECKCAKVSELF